ncbi:hypothetical protein RIR_jg24513.t1 [Rhizophagus irregularis DAOM 181602=DAOM 197198]|uniref:Uncharacterized protein n=2 Tax=Rhizophagus irregularis TaxID=588596 RepID=U9U920_RHIID|nr:hypothetical protein RIR_jg24513.t1 [Rhizophagus irregularis DAOM 181602=DAOM 197198]
MNGNLQLLEKRRTPDDDDDEDEDCRCYAYYMSHYLLISKAFSVKYHSKVVNSEMIVIVFFLHFGGNVFCTLLLNALQAFDSLLTILKSGTGLYLTSGLLLSAVYKMGNKRKMLTFPYYFLSFIDDVNSCTI